MEIELKVNVALPDGNNVAAVAMFEVESYEASIFALISEDGEAMEISLLTEAQIEKLYAQAFKAREEDCDDN